MAANYSAAGIPLDALWSDIDYMDRYEDFTTDPVKYPAEDMRDFVAGLHEAGQHYVVIIDPGTVALHADSGRVWPCPFPACLPGDT